MGHGVDLGVDKLVARAEGLLEGVAAGVGAGFAFVDFRLTSQPADMAVVVSDLAERAVLGQVVNPAVADVKEIESFGSYPAKAQGGAHARAFLVGGAELRQILVNECGEFVQQVGESKAETGASELKSAWAQLGDAIDGDAAGELTGASSADAIADGENQVGGGEGYLAGFP